MFWVYGVASYLCRLIGIRWAMWPTPTAFTSYDRFAGTQLSLWTTWEPRRLSNPLKLGNETMITGLAGNGIVTTQRGSG